MIGRPWRLRGRRPQALTSVARAHVRRSSELLFDFVGPQLNWIHAASNREGPGEESCDILGRRVVASDDHHRASSEIVRRRSDAEE